MNETIAKTANNKSQNLIAHEIPLTGKHLIEASAGTGKTYNITRIYLRMVLERKLPVEQILVMTFTKDATQELKGRIDSSIRDALANWSTLVNTDAFYQSIAKTVTEQEAHLLLSKALLFLDEAAIFTIHGFCQRVLSEHAFSTDIAFDAALETDMSGIVEQATQDCYRVLAAKEPQQFLLLSEFWHTPASFIQAFSKAIYRNTELSVLSPDHLITTFSQLIQQALTQLNENKTLIFQVIVDKQKGDKQTLRIEEYEVLHAWLTSLLNDPKRHIGNMPTTFYHGSRYAKSPQKLALTAIFNHVKQVKKVYDTFSKSLNKAKAFSLVRDAIYVIREKIKRQKQQVNILGFDDLISTLACALTEKPELAQRVAYDYPVALVDEFQDTDPEQFAILQAIYPQSADVEYESNSQPITTHTPAVFMIGDPKQAIYGFRSGDVFAYLAAREQCQYQWLMDTNWRSSQHMISGYNRLFYGDVYDDIYGETDGDYQDSSSHNCNNDGSNNVTNEVTSSEQALKTFGYNIPYWPVNASTAAKPELNTVIANDPYEALQFVHFDHEKADEQKVPQGFRPVMAQWCANEIARLLASSTESSNIKNTKSASTVNKQKKPAIQAQHIAVLVRDGTEAKEIKQALVNANLASVYLSNRSNLFNANEAKQLLTLLNGILYCDNDALFSAALTLPLLNYHPEAFYQLQQNQQQWQALKVTFESLRKHWQSKSFISMALKLLHSHIVIPKASQDRTLTNLLHLFELLQIASQRHHQPHELIYWFEQHLSALPTMAETELRLESDDNLIKIVTQHGSKGLEYPIVFIPFASRYKNPLKLGNQNVQLIEYHDDDKKLQLSIDGSDKAKAAMVDENHAETIRLLYVAITRAEQRCYVLTTDFEQADKSPLGVTVKAAAKQSLQQPLSALAQHEGIGFSLVAYDDTDAELESDLALEMDGSANNTHNDNGVNWPDPASFTSHIERDWWLSSFSALTRHTSHGGVSTPDRDNDTLAQNQVDESESHLIRFHLVKGAQTGNFLHDIFELLDFNDPNWEEALQRPLIKYHYLLADFSEQELVGWLNEVLETPLNNQHSFSLSDLTLDKTLREVEFYFPMKEASMSALANLLSEHRNFIYTNNDQMLSSGEVQATPPKVNLPLYRQLKGMMHGFIDLIFEHNGKYYVCDYKSSHLGNNFIDYSTSQLQHSMQGNYYDLQYLIYSLALHRYLAAQMPNYQVEQHFGGVYYLYLRGMNNNKANVDLTAEQTDNSTNQGVYFQTIPTQLLQQLDALFDNDMTKSESH